jgi:hypothetical protein
MIAHMRQMIEQGYTNEQIMELHPEIRSLFDGESNDATPGSNNQT